MIPSFIILLIIFATITSIAVVIYNSSVIKQAITTTTSIPTTTKTPIQTSTTSIPTTTKTSTTTTSIPTTTQTSITTTSIPTTTQTSITTTSIPTTTQTSTTTSIPTTAQTSTTTTSIPTTAQTSTTTSRIVFVTPFQMQTYGPTSSILKTLPLPPLDSTNKNKQLELNNIADGGYITHAFLTDSSNAYNFSVSFTFDNIGFFIIYVVNEIPTNTPSAFNFAIVTETNKIGIIDNNLNTIMNSAYSIGSRFTLTFNNTLKIWYLFHGTSTIPLTHFSSLNNGPFYIGFGLYYDSGNTTISNINVSRTPYIPTIRTTPPISSSSSAFLGGNIDMTPFNDAIIQGNKLSLYSQGGGAQSNNGFDSSFTVEFKLDTIQNSMLIFDMNYPEITSSTSINTGQYYISLIFDIDKSIQIWANNMTLSPSGSSNIYYPTVIFNSVNSNIFYNTNDIFKVMYNSDNYAWTIVQNNTELITYQKQPFTTVYFQFELLNNTTSYISGISFNNSVPETTTTSAPTTFNPTTSAPTTFNPTTSAPTTFNPTTSAPTTFNPTTSAPKKLSVIGNGAGTVDFISDTSVGFKAGPPSLSSCYNSMAMKNPFKTNFTLTETTFQKTYSLYKDFIGSSYTNVVISILFSILQPGINTFALRFDNNFIKTYMNTNIPLTYSIGDTFEITYNQSIIIIKQNADVIYITKYIYISENSSPEQYYFVLSSGKNPSQQSSTPLPSSAYYFKIIDIDYSSFILTTDLYPIRDANILLSDVVLIDQNYSGCGNITPLKKAFNIQFKMTSLSPAFFTLTDSTEIYTLQSKVLFWILFGSASDVGTFKVSLPEQNNLDLTSAIPYSIGDVFSVIFDGLKWYIYQNITNINLSSPIDTNIYAENYFQIYSLPLVSVSWLLIVKYQEITPNTTPPPTKLLAYDGAILPTINSTQLQNNGSYVSNKILLSEAFSISFKLNTVSNMQLLLIGSINVFIPFLEMYFYNTNNIIIKASNLAKISANIGPDDFNLLKIQYIAGDTFQILFNGIDMWYILKNGTLISAPIQYTYKYSVFTLMSKSSLVINISEINYETLSGNYLYPSLSSDAFYIYDGGIVENNKLKFPNELSGIGTFYPTTSSEYFEISFILDSITDSYLQMVLDINRGITPNAVLNMTLNGQNNYAILQMGVYNNGYSFLPTDKITLIYNNVIKTFNLYRNDTLIIGNYNYGVNFNNIDLFTKISNLSNVQGVISDFLISRSASKINLNLKSTFTYMLKDNLRLSAGSSEPITSFYNSNITLNISKITAHFEVSNSSSSDIQKFVLTSGVYPDVQTFIEQDVYNDNTVQPYYFYNTPTTPFIITSPNGLTLKVIGTSGQYIQFYGISTITIEYTIS